MRSRGDGGGTVIACPAPYGSGGLGQHFSHLVERARAGGMLVRYFAGGRIRAGDEAVGEVIRLRRLAPAFRVTPLRFSPGWQAHLHNRWFDAAVARRLTGPIDTLIAFNGAARASFRRARELGCCNLCLVSATAHVEHVAERYERARARHPIEPGWLNRAQVRATLEEYALADTILVASDYARQSFVDRGVDPRKLRRVRYPVNPRFAPPRDRPDDGVFRIVYSGAVTVAKGVPILLEAFARLPAGAPAELRLIGNTCTRGMRRYVEHWVRRDPRIRVAPGDPLPALRSADAYVHPSYQDGFGYAPMEALACGVPVIVTADTGMKEHVVQGVNGYVVPTGDVDALADRLRCAMDRAQTRICAPRSRGATGM